MVFREELKDVLENREACAVVLLKNWNYRSWPACFQLVAVTGEAGCRVIISSSHISKYAEQFAELSIALEVTSVSASELSRHNYSLNFC